MPAMDDVLELTAARPRVPYAWRVAVAAFDHVARHTVPLIRQCVAPIRIVEGLPLVHVIAELVLGRRWCGRRGQRR